MKIRIVQAVLFGLAFVNSALAEEPVYFPDAVLKTAVENALWVWDPTPTDMLDLVSLGNIGTFSNQNDGIKDLTGLEYAANLQTLNLRLNRITDIGPLAGLTELQSIDLSQNAVSDLSPLSGLVNLEYLNFHGNQISDVSPLAGLTGLRTLILRINRITDISDLTGLDDLEHLDLYCNKVSDISALAGLVYLQTLDLEQNKISDLSPLAGMTNLQELDLQSNWVSDLSPLAGLSDLRYLDLHENFVTDVSGLIGVTSLRSLDLRDNELDQDAYCSDLETLVEQNPGVDLRYTPHCSAPSNVVVSNDAHLSWDEVCNGPLYSTYYRVYRSISADESAAPISEWQTDTTFDDTTAESGINYAYWVQAATSSQGDDASSLSEAATVSLPHSVALRLSSTTGGSVTVPGEGTFLASYGQTVTIAAYATDPDRYCFAGWTGSAAEAGKVSNPGSARTTVVADGTYTLKACFVACAGQLYVDSVATDGANADGTRERPFRTIQQAIDVAAEGATIVVRPGLYPESVDLLGKGIQLTGLDPNGAPLPTLTGSGPGPVVSFTHGEDPNCMLVGFAISAGQALEGSAVVCAKSSPVIANCLIVGNRSTASDGAAIHCTESQAVFDNCTIADNIGGEDGAGLRLLGSPIVLTNSIVWANAPSQIIAAGPGEPVVTYTNVQDAWPGAGNLNIDPLFAQQGQWLAADDSNAVWMAGNYYLKSEAGRWDPDKRAWIQDDVTSECIDAGDPAPSVGAEPAPNGGVINMGAYGGTAQAGKSIE